MSVASAAAVACAARGSENRITRFEERARNDDTEIEALSVRVAAFEEQVDELVALYHRADADFEGARRRFEQVGRLAAHTGGLYEQARRDYETAEANWKRVTIAILSAAMWDYAGHLCGTRMTTAQYRRELRHEGVELEGLDADHGLPRSWGGADHPLNYEMIDSSLNRSLGNDIVRKLMEHPAHLLQGAVISGLMRLRCSPQL